MKEETA